MNAPDHPPVAETWDLFADGAHDPALNMALDEALLESAPGRRRPLLRFYGWDRPAVSIGYLQHAAAAPAAGCSLVRRTTGGGVVFHDHDFTYSLVVAADHGLARGERLRSYALVNAAVGAALQRCHLDGILAAQEIPAAVNRRTMVCFRTPTRYDVLVAGRKVAGSAQRRTRAGLLHQGSIHFGDRLPVPRAVLAQALLAGFRAQFGITFTPWQPDDELLAHADRLVRQRYGTDAWNRRL